MRRRSGSPFLFVLILLMLSDAGLRAQTAAPGVCTDPATIIDLADDIAARLRSDQLRGRAPVTALTIRRASQDRRTVTCPSTAPPRDTGLMQFRALPVRVRSTYNSAYPLDINNGALWAGRGWNGAVSAGAEVRAGPFSAAVYPVAAYQENQTFQMARPSDNTVYSAFTYAGHVMDWPQRHGDAAFSSFDLGQSYVRVDAFGFAAGLSTENLWFGPAQRMPLLMGSSAPGVPHLFIGTSRPRDIYVGSVEAQLTWGRLSESDYFDNATFNDRRLIASLSAVFEPAFARGLFVGINRVYMGNLFNWDLSLLTDPYGNPRENNWRDNQLLSLYARWVLPAAGFEAYAEWGREDGWGIWNDLLLEPDHSQVYLLGFQKTGRYRSIELRWFGELLHLEAALPLRGGRGVQTFYTHTELTQGYTERGQLLGAWIGPGSDGQVLGFERSDGRRVTGLLVERVRYDDDAYYNVWGNIYGNHGHDVSLGATLHHVEPLGPFEVRAALGAARRQNRNFAYFDGTHPGNFRSETNVQLDVDLRWVPKW